MDGRRWDGWVVIVARVVVDLFTSLSERVPVAWMVAARLSRIAFLGIYPGRA
jgi:hypothetical protein